jgi:hypothetical protein
MQRAVVILAILATGGLSVTFADPPATPAAATPPASSAVAPASDVPLQEKWLRNQGYKPYMMNNEKVFCKRETPIGSHLATTLHCLTAAEAELMAKEGKDTVERLQRNMTSCLAPGAHAVANCGS